MTSNQRNSALSEALFNPARVALIGVSSNPKKNTARPLRFSRQHGCEVVLYPINHSQSEVLGEQAWSSVNTCPTPVDHAFVMVSSDLIMGQLEACAQAGVKVVTVYSDGFGEAGPEGQQKQNELLAKARELGLRVIGPNSIGLANLQTGLIMSVNAVFEAPDLIAGSVSLVSQSGSMMGSLLSRAAARGLGFAKTISVGNESDVSVGEIVDVLVDDDSTKVILLFLETIRDAPCLASALARARAAGKPVIAYKLGRSEQGDALAQSHTGALAGNDKAVDAFLKAHGVLRVRQLETLFEIIPLATTYRRPIVSGNRSVRVAVITTTGGGAATVVDNLGLESVEAVAPPQSFIDHMQARGLNLRPVPVMDLTLAGTSEQYQDLLEQLLECDWCDAVLSVVGSSAQFHPELAVKPITRARKSEQKPLVVFLAPEALASLQVLQQAGIAAFRTPESCAQALALFFEPPHQPPPERKSVVWPVGLPSKGTLSEYQSGQVFASLGVKLAPQMLVQHADEVTLDYPVVAKISSADILHKTEVNGVKVGLADANALANAMTEIANSVREFKPNAKLDGYLVQTMQPKLIELLLGYRRDPLVGPTVLLGAGGVAAELMPDVSIRLAPVTLEQAWQMIEEVTVTQVVRGYRNLPRGDCQALAQTIVAFSQLACYDEPSISEAEINPLFVQNDGVVAVDGLVSLVES
ncbi:acetate--CoA ligase family protein [Orrella daihaiensis]|uniref:Acetate--CoA ligase family protein n=1 Tax=Orrella daihaiensis TaxID=2782176 RepID=A0ABY4AI78_9BURK|nr:acetate--CoA ligase family protein [Orrella daihaiensis]UOD49995.1 acetate--CoA ligase family protein [Orrella daihaiensis]